MATSAPSRSPSPRGGRARPRRQRRRRRPGGRRGGGAPAGPRRRLREPPGGGGSRSARRERRRALCGPIFLSLALDGGPDGVAPLRPGAVVVADVVVAEQVLEHEPGVAGALPDTAVGDDLAVAGEAGLALVDLLELVRALEGAVLPRRPRPR